MAKKGNLRSIRFTDEMIELIEAQEGNSFTDKLEKLVRRCVEDLPRKQQELNAIQTTIENERQRLHRIRSKANEIENAAYQLSASLQSWNRQATAAVEKLEAQAEGL